GDRNVRAEQAALRCALGDALGRRLAPLRHRPRHRESARTPCNARSRPSPSLPLAAEPARRIDGWTAVSYLEVEMRRQIGIADADRADLVAFCQRLVQTDICPRERAVNRVVAATVLDDDRRPVC